MHTLTTVALSKHPAHMTAGDIMRLAHKIAKQAHKVGECYAVTFGASLRLVYQMLKVKPVPSMLSIAALVAASFVVLYCLGFTGYSLEAGSIGYAILFSVFAAISAFVGLTAAKEGFKIRLNISKQA
jgi:uncharacterized membrane protein